MLLQRLTGSPIFAGSTAALFLIFPLGQIYLLFPLQLLVPLPIYLVAMRLGIKEGVMAGLVPIIFCLGILGQLALPLIATYLVMIWFPLLAAWLTRGGWRPIQVLGSGYFLALIVLFLFLLWSALTGNGMMEAIFDHMMESKKSIISTMAQSNEVDAKVIVEMEQGLDEAFRLFSRLFPALFLMSWFMVQVANLLLVRYLSNRWQMQLIPKQDLDELRIPFILVWPLIAFALLAFATSGSTEQFGLNLVLFLAIPYFFQGMSVVSKGFLHYKVTVFVRTVFYMVLIMWSAMIFMVTVLGLLDTWANFRNRLISREE